MSKFKKRLHEKMKEAEMMPKLDLPVVIGRLQSLGRFYVGAWPDGSPSEDEEVDGEWVRWDDIEELIEGLKKDNARSSSAKD
jgi:hypothetical protein